MQHEGPGERWRSARRLAQCRARSAVRVRDREYGSSAGAPKYWHASATAGDGQSHEESRATPDLGLEREGAPVPLDDDRARVRQPLPRSPADALGREERLEQSVADGVGDPGAGVL